MLAVGCDALEEAAKDLIEKQTGCKADQLTGINNPDLPNCSKVAACCKFVQGECGETTMFTFPQEVVDACKTNETVIKKAFTEYEGITADNCPEYLNPDACTEGLEKTRENYVNVVDKGVMDSGTEGAPSCKLIVDETVVPLNEQMGENADYLPKACEVGTENVSPDLDVVTSAEK
jgi:hypothetical protein